MDRSRYAAPRLVFVIRIRKEPDTLRIQVVSVTTGVVQVFSDLPETLKFIQAQVNDQRPQP